MPAALRSMRELCGWAADDGLETANLEAWARACCAAEAFAEFGEGRVGGYAIGDFRVTNCVEKGTPAWRWRARQRSPSSRARDSPSRGRAAHEVPEAHTEAAPA